MEGIDGFSIKITEYGGNFDLGMAFAFIF